MTPTGPSGNRLKKEGPAQVAPRWVMEPQVFLWTRLNPGPLLGPHTGPHTGLHRALTLSVTARAPGAKR